MMLQLLLLFLLFNLCSGWSSTDPLDGYNLQQIHIAQGRTPESMTISWVTPATTSTTSASQVRYGTGSGDMNQLAEGFSTSYTFQYASYQQYTSGLIHHVRIDNLKPDTRYYYQCGDFTTDVVSGTLTFKTLPKVGEQRPISFGVVGDLGTTNDSYSTLKHLIANPDLKMILHAGDLSYADCKQEIWDQYGVMIEDLAKERYAGRNMFLFLIC